jgi:hypothetical protein
MEYDDLLKYPEFDQESIFEKYTVEIGRNDADEPMMQYPDFVFDTKVALNYVILVYAPDSELASIKDLTERKELAMKKAKVQEKYKAKVLHNENPMIGDMLTRFFREYEDFDYELLISAKEALITLLEVVRKPIDSRLLDDKERNAVKAKRECFDDAKYMMSEIRKMLSDLGLKSEDAQEHVKKSVFKAGLAEHLAGKSK